MIIWGTKRKLKKIGVVADFCPICREIQPFQVSSVSMVNHLYFLSLGSGKIVGFIGVCKDCGIERPVQAQKYPQTYDQEPDSFQELINNTYPDIYNLLEKRLELEQRISKRGSLTPEEREGLLSEPFEIIGPMLERQYGESTRFDKNSGRSCAVTLLIPLVFFCISAFFFNRLVVDILKINSLYKVFYFINLKKYFKFEFIRYLKLIFL